VRVPFNVKDFLDRAVEVYPERIALVDEPGVPGALGQITYRELGHRVEGMALFLQELGIGIGDRVGIVSPNAGKFLISYFGVSGYGRILVPINYRLSREDVAYIAEHSRCRVLLIDPEFEEVFGDIPVEHRFVMDGVGDAQVFAPRGTREAPTPWEGDENQACSINYTSGTTSRPKGVQMTHRNAWVNATTLGWHVGVDDKDVLLHTLPMFHCNGWGMPYAATGMGARHVIQRKIDGGSILSRVASEGLTLACGAPAVWSAVLAASETFESDTMPGRGSMRIVMAGAAPPSKTIQRVEDELGWEFIQIYGLTETSPLLTVNRTTKEMATLDSAERARMLSRAGTAAIGVQISVDVDGEVLARGNQVFEGYWNQPEQTEEAFRGGWFHTGDGGLYQDGYLTILDRQKDIIITGGENVSSIEVEDTLYQNPAVAEVAVIGVPDEKWGETIKALVVLREGSKVTEEELIEFCRSRMAHFKCPTSVEFRSELTRTATGKLQKYLLREPYWKGYEKRVN